MYTPGYTYAKRACRYRAPVENIENKARRETGKISPRQHTLAPHTPCTARVVVKSEAVLRLATVLIVPDLDGFS